MAVWSFFAALAVLAFIGPVQAQNNHAVMMPGVNSRSSSIDRSVRDEITPIPNIQLAPIYFPTNLQKMFDQPATVPLSAENRAVQERGTPYMVMTDDMDIDMMDIGNLRMMNSLSTMEELAAMFGIEMPVATNESGNVIVARFGSRGTEVKLDQANCKPENKTVHLNITAEQNVVYLPSCVRLQRCGGCCQGPMFECQPNKTEAINIKVMRVTSSPTPARSSGSERGRGRPGSSGGNTASRRRPRNIAEMITVPGVQHIECDCLCRVQEKHCNLTLQEYMPDNCKCQCRNRDEEDKCVAQRMTHYWNEKQCKCLCHNADNCTVSLLFDHTTCGCVLPNEGSANNPRAGYVGDNALDEEYERFRHDRIPITFAAPGRRWGGATRAREQLPRA